MNENKPYNTLKLNAQDNLHNLDQAQGHYTATAETILIWPSGQTHAQVYNKQNYLRLQHADELRCNGIKWQIRTIKQTNNVVIRCLSRATIDTPQLGYMRFRDFNAKPKIKLLLPVIDSIRSKFLKLDLKKVELEFEPELFRKLCLYNFSGNKTIAELKSYGLGFIMKKVVISNTVLQTQNVSYTALDVHVLLCSITMTTQNQRRQQAFYILDRARSWPFAKQTVARVMNSGVFFTVWSVILALQTVAFTGTIISNPLMEPFIQGVGTEMARSILNPQNAFTLDCISNSDQWKNALSTAYSFAVGAPQIVEINKTTIQDSIISACPHHSTTCVHIFRSLSPSETDVSGKCECCQATI